MVQRRFVKNFHGKGHKVGSVAKQTKMSDKVNAKAMYMVQPGTKEGPITKAMYMVQAMRRLQKK